eukprot:5640948-Prorocentrum_lima.AAC.1
MAPAISDDVATVFYSLRIASVVPFEWRSGKLAAVVKVGKASSSRHNFRPIILGNHLAKAFARSLLAEAETHLKLAISFSQFSY